MSDRFKSPDEIRAAFSATMSEMYAKEVPAYSTLMQLVYEVNEETLGSNPELQNQLAETESLARITEERHGAIRVGTASELSMLRRVFAIMGMFPVGYYDLSIAGVPVHATAFRPTEEAALKRNPFRVFTSLLRLDLITDEALREEAAAILSKRQIFTEGAISLTEKAERDGGLNHEDATTFISEVLETFRWHDQAKVSGALYRRLHDAHRLIADVVSFKGPHINHLTPRTLDIDLVQQRMPLHGITPKAVVEGPPTRMCPILLRQTSFKALEEAVSFLVEGGSWQVGSHTARFGEIEQRGIALTPKGRGLYDMLLNRSREVMRPAADGSNASDYMKCLAEAFQSFPDTWDAIREQGLGYFVYSLTAKGKAANGHAGTTLEQWVAEGLVRFDPIVYEDFLPVSAAGIFQSNLGDETGSVAVASANQIQFERDLGTPVLDQFEHYAEIENASIEACRSALFGQQVAAE